MTCSRCSHCKPLKERPHVVYRLRDADGRLLYVGMTSKVMGRMGEHAHDKPWFELVARIDVEHYANGAEAASAEALAIVAEMPVHNADPYMKKERVSIPTDPHQALAEATADLNEQTLEVIRLGREAGMSDAEIIADVRGRDSEHAAVCADAIEAAIEMGLA